MNTCSGTCHPYSAENKISQIKKLIYKETGQLGVGDTRTVFSYVWTWRIIGNRDISKSPPQTGRTEELEKTEDCHKALNNVSQ